MTAMKRLKTSLSLVGAAMLVLTGCSSISSGTITNRAYEEAHTTTSMVCSMYVKGVCSIWTPITTRHPEQWRFDLAAGEDTGWVHVDHEVYDAYAVGDQYNAPADRQ